MTDQPVTVLQKLATIWSSRRACNITLSIRYKVREENGCKIYKLYQVQELETR